MTEPNLAPPDALKVGDIVVLRSGGPKMTVTGVWTSGHCNCRWFDDEWNCKEAKLAVGALNRIDVHDMALGDLLGTLQAIHHLASKAPEGNHGSADAVLRRIAEIAQEALDDDTGEDERCGAC